MRNDNSPMRMGVLAVAISIASQAMAVDNMPPMPPDTTIPFIEEKVVEVTLDDGTTLELTESEVEQIRIKQRTLQKYRYEQDELAEERRALAERERQNNLDAALTNRMPLDPKEIRDIRQRELEVKAAENSPVTGDVKFDMRTIELDVEEPRPIEISVSKGFASSIVFFDENGAPWPIVGDKVIADESAFSATILTSNPHMAVFEIKREFAQSNALITLQDMPLPVTIKLSGEEGKVDSRLIVRIPQFGPLSQSMPVTQTRRQIQNVSDAMLAMLNGGRLPGGVEYQLNGVDGTVFVKDGRMFIRTKAFLKAPPALAEQISPTGVNVYELLPRISLLFSVNGEQVTAKVEEKPQIQLSRKSSIFGGN